MSKVAVVYWSGIGNTEMMAQMVEAGIVEAGGSASVMTSAKFNSDMIDEFDAIAFCCPSMGSEQLEESEFEPMFREVEDKLSGKKIALFGSYGWGDGEWMRNWEDECSSDGATMAHESVICCGAPDDSANEDLKALGKALV
ncbi:flavodoxin [Anaerofustis butyriciformans]|uniref:flavodoxin n=1 Tax=Anaerofustis butyriciformans TaxID=3108533 RepID=UPI003F8AEBB8